MWGEAASSTYGSPPPPSIPPPGPPGPPTYGTPAPYPYPGQDPTYSSPPVYSTPPVATNYTGHPAYGAPVYSAPPAAYGAPGYELHPGYLPQGLAPPPPPSFKTFLDLNSQCLATIASFFIAPYTLTSLSALYRTCKNVYLIFLDNKTWEHLYEQSSNIPMANMKRYGNLVIPPTCDFRKIYVIRYRSQNRLRNVRVVANADFVRCVDFNVPESDVDSSTFVLKNGEFITEVHTRKGKIYDAVAFLTNFGRIHRIGGSGGEEYTVHKGGWLFEISSTTEKWHFKTVLTKFEPLFNFDPVLEFVANIKVVTITIITGDFLNYIEFLFNNGTVKRGGGNIENIQYPYVKQVIHLKEDEYIIGYELRTGALVDSIALWSNQRGLGTFGGNGGKPMPKQGAPEFNQGLIDINIKTIKKKDDFMVEKILEPKWGVMHLPQDNAANPNGGW